MKHLVTILLLLSLSIFAEGKKVKLDSKSWSKLNVFLSNFAESELPFFEKDSISNADLIKFGIHHNAINYPKEMKSNSKNANYPNKISKKAIYNAVDKYFGKKLTNKNDEKILIFSEGENEDKKDFYLIPEKDFYLLPIIPVQIDPITTPTGETQKFTQVIDMIDLSKSVYEITANIYGIGFMELEDISKKKLNNLMYSVSVDKWKEAITPSIMTKIKAVVKKDKSGLYKLISYTEVKIIKDENSGEIKATE
ncbi:hypothetical protein JXR93_08975 [bacterium]|nr:hypothetical protein [bacterium]